MKKLIALTMLSGALFLTACSTEKEADACCHDEKTCCTESCANECSENGGCECGETCHTEQE